MTTIDTTLVDVWLWAVRLYRQPRMRVREPGTGRPTKRERRELERFRRP